MTVKDFAEKYGYRILCLPDAAREIQGGYAGDLLSWVMGRLQPDCAWVTIMSNVNIVAVASLADPACIILSENVVPDEGVLSRAEQQGVNILSTERTTFEACSQIASAL